MKQKQYSHCFVLCVNNKKCIYMGIVTNFFAPEFIQFEQKPAFPEPNEQSVFLDKNECPYDLTDVIKTKVVVDLFNENWNRYPHNAYKDVYKFVSKASQCAEDNIVLASGAASIITSFLNYFAINKKDIVIARPSFSLYHYHCSLYNIPYKNWDLNNKLEYDIGSLPPLSKNSVVLFASPNNPIGNVLEKDDLLILLETNPDTLFILDEVYHEFSAEQLAHLVQKYDNLILIRSFSKSHAIAGIRLGYALANSKLAAQLRKLIQPFTLNLFTVAFASSLCNEESFFIDYKIQILKILLERERIYERLTQWKELKVFYSHANFLSIQFLKDSECKQVYSTLLSNGIVVLNTSNEYKLSNSLRITIGTEEDNELLLSIINKTMNKIIDKTQKNEEAVIVYKNNNVEIIYDKVQKQIVQHWQKFVPSEIFRAAIDQTVAFVMKNEVNTLISDTLNQNVVSSENAKYAASTTATLFANGLKAMAFIMPDDVFTKLSLNTFAENGHSDRIEYFSDSNDANIWLHEILAETV